MDTKDTQEQKAPLGLTVGLCLGIALGSAMGNIPIGIAMGLAFGVGIDHWKKKKSQKDDKGE
ncbi:MAG: hypothetical protein Q4Q17_02660 [Tissierellia bacterium]|nr:hypothetical protein [Tissierellia bacterium]